jgi:hypothetical protein
MSDPYPSGSSPKGEAGCAEMKHEAQDEGIRQREASDFETKYASRTTLHSAPAVSDQQDSSHSGNLFLARHCADQFARSVSTGCP